MIAVANMGENTSLSALVGVRPELLFVILAKRSFV
jgi:hypothetical protein